MFVNYFSDPYIIQPLDNSRTRTICIDSYSIHNESPELLQALQLSRTKLKRFRPNCTSIAQSLDQLVLLTFKAEWRKRWEKRRNELAQESEFTSPVRIYNPGKYFFLQLVKEDVDELNCITIGNIPLPRNSLTTCGLIPDEDEVCKLEQLTPELRNMVESNMAYFHGQDPST